MSPTSRELVSNKSLAGPELAAIILADVSRMLAENGLLNSQMAYPRVAYDLRLTLHMEMQAMPTATEHVVSRNASVQQQEANPALAALEPFPLASPAPDAILDAHALSRDIASPNVARIEHSLPVDVAVTGQDGHEVTRQVIYPQDVAKEQFVEPDLSGVSDEVRRELGL